jgi:acetoin utilization deacetylase AcuC-like enzyme
MSRVNFGQIPIDFLQKLHSKSHIEKVLSAEVLSEDEISHMFGEDNSENRFTPECARLAAGGALEGMKSVVSSLTPVKSAFCLIRPPGHHAMAETTDGYCFFNNAGMAAHYAKELFGLTRVCILDWDVHHGDGTQDLFYESDDVLFMSVHRFENQKYFPYKPTAGHEYVGSGKGEGYNVNVAWSTTEDKNDESKVGTKEYKYLFENLLFGIIQEYDPQLLILSAGFDSAKGDPLGKQQVEHETYHWLCENLQKICPKILMVLEGGYNMETLVS